MIMKNLPYERIDTVFLRCMAILLIVNSHLDTYYPISIFATGGAIGNCIFLSLSTFGLYFSERKHKRTFQEYYTRRILRIYPSVWVVIILIKLPLDMMHGGISLTEILPFAGHFFYPPNWFLRAIMVYYIIFFVLFTNFSSSRIVLFFGINISLYLICYMGMADKTQFVSLDPGISVIFYLLPFVFGILLAKNTEKIKYEGIKDWILLGLCLFIIYAHKFLMFRGVYGQFQIIQLTLLFPLLFFALKVSRSSLIREKLFSLKLVDGFMRFIYPITLEIYIVHELLNEPIASLNIAFPLNLIIYLLLSFSLAYTAKKLSLKLFSFAET